MTNILFNEAAPIKYCGEKTGTSASCINAYESVDCVGGSWGNVESGTHPCPNGYKNAPATNRNGTPGAGIYGNLLWCGGQKAYRHCTIDEASPRWAPMVTRVQTAKSSKLLYKAAIDDVYKCYNGDAETHGDKLNCGSLWDSKQVEGVAKKTTENLIKNFCEKYPEYFNEIGGTCHNYLKNNKDTINIERLCNVEDRWKKPEWETLCACYKPTSFYEKLNDSIRKEWSMPPGYEVITPECIYNNCKNSPFYDTIRAKRCDGFSFASCHQNLTVNLADAAIGGDFIANQESDCESSFRRKTTDSQFDTETALPRDDLNPINTPRPAEKPPDPAEKPPDPAEKQPDPAEKSDSKTRILMFVAVCFFVIIAMFFINTSDSTRGGVYIPLNSY